MAKKKKPQLKHGAVRGFATTSIPKKVAPVEEAAPPTDQGSASKGPPNEPAESSGEPSGATQDVQQNSESSPIDPAEQQYLQAMIDKYQEKTEKEISRSTKTLEVEKRASKGFNTLQIDPLLVEQILRLHLEEEALGALSVRQHLDQAEEKATTHLAVTYGVLRRLGFSENWVEQCLRSIAGIELDEAFEWLFVHCPENEIETNPYAPPNSTVDDQLGTLYSTETGASTPATSSTNAPPSSHSPSLVDPIPPDDVQAMANSSNRSSKRSSPEPEDPNVEYSRVKLQLFHLRRSDASNHQKTHATNLLEQKVRTLKSHYFFDQRDAESLYRSRLDKAKAQLLQGTLRGSLEPAGPDSSDAPATSTTQPAPEPHSDLFDEEDESGGLLDILEAPQEIQCPGGKTIPVKDMAFHKQGGVKLPKAVLLEYVSKVDRYAAVTFSNISGGSRAKRSGVRVLWGGRRVSEWRMEDVACHEESQAEQYIATIALHSLSFPPTEGFAAGAMVSPVGLTFFRSFPPVFRELWDQLEADRQLREDHINKQVWSKIRSITVQKIDTDPSRKEAILESTLGARDNTHASIPLRNPGVNHAQLMADLKSRQMRPAYNEMLIHRNSLPIARYREDIISTLENSQVLVLCGETGCGKSTQVPAFILEDQLSRGQPCKVYCTEPRRISAVSLAQRVSRELGDPPGAVGTFSSLVGYSIRLESNTTKNTRLTYLTNGIALRMLERGSGREGRDTAFDEVTHIIIDEVHERTIESDFLLIVLKFLLPLRPDLRVVLMSATMDAEKLANYFGGCPVIHVPGRTFPVDTMYLEDAVELTGWSISEDSPLARRRRDKFYQRKNRTDWDEAPVIDDDDDVTLVEGETNDTPLTLEKRYSQFTEQTVALLDERIIPYDLIVRLLEHVCFKDASLLSFSSAVLVFMPGLAEIRRLNDLLTEHPSFGEESSFRIYPLHSTLSSENQNAVFDIPPSGVRKIVIATNIAETGITIPDITCVIDTGKQREIMFDEKRQLSRLVETFVAKSNATQRRGRAGRVQNGICFHLFTQHRHDTLLAEHPLPEMTRLSLSDLALRIKTMKVKFGASIEDVLCQALDPPTSINVQRAVAALVEVRALTSTEDITPLGRLLSKLPTDVHIGKFLLIAVVFRCLDPALTIAASMGSKSPFVTPLGLEYEADRAKDSFRVDNSDFLTIHNAFAAWRRASSNTGFAHKFCRKNFLSNENLLQIEELRQQFLGYLVDSAFIQVEKEFEKELSRARFGRNRHRFVAVPTEFDSNSNNLAVINSALLSGLYPKLLCIDPKNGANMSTLSNNKAVSFHPSSVNFRRNPKDLAANHLVHFTLMHSKKLYAWETAPVDDLAILLLCGECDFKLMSNSAIVDRKIKFQLTPRTNVAMKILRTQLSSILAQRFRGKPMTESQLRWHELAMNALGRVKLIAEIEDNETAKIQIQ